MILPGMLLSGGLTGCGSAPRGTSGSEAGSAGDSSAVRRADRAAAWDFDAEAVAGDIRRFLVGDGAAGPVARGRTAVVVFGRFVNHTESSAEGFAEFREAFERRLTAAGRRAGVLFEPAGGGPPVGAVEMHTAVLPIGGGDGGEKRWLVRMLIVGPDASGRRRTLWSDTLVTRPT